MSSVKVAVRVRPFNNREISRQCESIIEMSGATTGECKKSLSISFYANFEGRKKFFSFPSHLFHFYAKSQAFLQSEKSNFV